MAGSLGVSVTAEGIERERQRDLLRMMGCGRGQGYLFGAAMRADALEAWVAERAVPGAG
jgi:EAL domain-containing protein (putative c-di-GMP-specific phosphodiesterase class I)